MQQPQLGIPASPPSLAPSIKALGPEGVELPSMDAPGEPPSKVKGSLIYSFLYSFNKHALDTYIEESSI
jgi:hypothetical protein